MQSSSRLNIPLQVHKNDSTFQAFVNYEDSGLGLAEISHRYVRCPVGLSHNSYSCLQENNLTLALKLIHRNEDSGRDEKSIDSVAGHSRQL